MNFENRYLRYVFIVIWKFWNRLIWKKLQKYYSFPVPFPQAFPNSTVLQNRSIIKTSDLTLVQYYIKSRTDLSRFGQVLHAFFTIVITCLCRFTILWKFVTCADLGGSTIIIIQNYCITTKELPYSSRPASNPAASGLFSDYKFVTLGLLIQIEPYSM